MGGWTRQIRFNVDVAGNVETDGGTCTDKAGVVWHGPVGGHEPDEAREASGNPDIMPETVEE